MEFHGRRFGGLQFTSIDFFSTDFSEPVTLSQAIRASTDGSAAAVDDSDADANVLFGTLKGNVVGLQYYTGTVNKGEMISLVREPQNPYDRNAIMVANVYGNQVGHIRRQLAAPMAHLMDNNLAKVEGVVPFGVTNKFSMPVILSFWGREENRAAVLEELSRHKFRLAPVSTVGQAFATPGRQNGAGTSVSPKKFTPVAMTVEELKNAFDKLFDDLMEDKTRTKEAAKAVATPLLVHQKQALHWMCARENTDELPIFWEERNGLFFNVLTNFAVRERPQKLLGGILADDMGLGKTLTTIALIVSNFRDGKALPLEQCGTSSIKTKATKVKRSTKAFEGDRGEEGSSSSLPKRPHKECSLAVDLESKDVEEMLVPKKKAKTTVKTGKGGAVLLDDTDFATALSGSPAQGSSFKKKAQKTHGEESVNRKSSGKSGARPTLIICPLSVLSNWLDQFEQHLSPDAKLNVYLYYGTERNRHAHFLSGQDVVLTTYNVLSADYGNQARSPLHAVSWLRVVLDEGHIIRNPAALQSKAVLNLRAERRWILSGTPIQNSLKDMWMLLSFLRLKPFDVKEWWNRVIQRPVTLGDSTGLKNLQTLVRGITLRRTKASHMDGRPVVELPARSVFVQHITLSQDERQEYELARTQGRSIIGRYVREGTVLTNYADVLAILVRLRQLCCHPHLLGPTAGKGGEATPDDLRERLIQKMTLVLSSGSDEECAVCLDSLRQPVITHCAHVYCRPCICQVICSEQEQAKCPLCRAEIKVSELVEYPGEEEEEGVTDGREAWRSSAKVEALMTSLQRLRSEDGSIKCLVVSQFTKFLSLIQIPLKEHGFSFTRLDGSMPQRKRAQAIQDFQNAAPGSPTVMLLSLKAGGVGLNLTAASHVFLMDPAWNPASEDQCVDRCHRLGQTRDVVITKFIVKDSVEENMVKIQKQKRRLVEKAFGTAEKKQSRIDDIRALMEV